MSELLGIDYDVLALDLTESESRHRALVSDPTPPSAPPALPEPGAIARTPVESAPSTITTAPRPGHEAAAPTRRPDDMAPRGGAADSHTAGGGDLLPENAEEGREGKEWVRTGRAGGWGKK